MNRNEYMDSDKCTNGAYDGSKGALVHAAYFSQFVTPSAIKYVAEYIGAQTLLNSRDYDLNDISMSLWDNLPLWPAMAQALKAAGDNTSLSSKVCIWKQAARLWLASNGGLPAWRVKYGYPSMPGDTSHDLYGFAIGPDGESAAALMHERNRMYAYVEYCPFESE